MTLIIFFLILSILVLIHEFGHFFTAKKSGITVEEFGLGIPPTAFKKKFGDTTYSLNWLPLGGFVKLFGEDSFDSNVENHPNSYSSKPWYVRLLVIIAGVVMNLVFAVILYYIFFISNNFKSYTMPVIYDHHFLFGNKIYSDTTITGFSDESNLKNLNILPGDSILSVNGKNVKDVRDIKKFVKENPDIANVTIKKLNSNEINEIFVKPIKNENQEWVLGVYLSKSVVLTYDKPYQKIFSGFMHTYNMFFYSTGSLYHLIAMSFKNQDASLVSQGVSGPVGIYNVVGNIVQESNNNLFLTLLDFTALLSISLAFINMLPIPALDGGRLIFILIEGIRSGKKINRELEAKIHGYGMIFLLGLFVLVTIKDLFQ